MASITSPILLDSTGKDIAAQVKALQGGVSNETAKLMLEQLKLQNALMADSLNANYYAEPWYDGVNLADKFNGEIASYANAWDWMQDRLDSKYFGGLHVADYIPITLSNGDAYKCQIAGINTYKGHCDTEVKSHIDFISKELLTANHVMNPANWNNGITTPDGEIPQPWLASELYKYLNSLKGYVPNSADSGSIVKEVDFTTTGVFTMLPNELKSKIVEKRFLLERRFTSGSKLTSSNGWDWKDIGKLWIPTEVEVAGMPVWGGTGYANGASVQYPIFANSNRRAKSTKNGRAYWWVLTPHQGSSTHFGTVTHNGYVSPNTSASYTYITAPLCFRLQAAT